MKFPKIKIRPRIILFTFLGLIITIIFAGFIAAYYYLGIFSKAIDKKPKNIFNQAIEGIRNPYSEKYLNFLILGLDKRPDDNSLLTDTIMVVSFNQDSGDYLMFSIPRDLWIDEMQTKINALYYYGQKENPNDGTSLVESEVEKILDTEINYSLVLEMEDIKNLVDILGGVEVEVERSFTDYFFPLDDGSHQVTTVSFKKGIHNRPSPAGKTKKNNFGN